VPDSFSSGSTIRQVTAKLGSRSREILLRHGYDVGEGFVDNLSQYQSLENAARADRLRDLEGLLKELNSAD
jgi:hypothetical protein